MVVLLRGRLAARDVLRGNGACCERSLVREMMGERGMGLGCMGIVRSSVGVQRIGATISRIRVSLPLQLILTRWNSRYKY